MGVARNQHPLLFLGATRIHEFVIDTLLKQGLHVFVVNLRGPAYLPANARAVSVEQAIKMPWEPKSVFWFSEDHFHLVERVLGSRALELSWRGRLNDKGFQRDQSSMLAPPSFGCTNLNDERVWRHELISLGGDFVVKPSLDTGGSMNVARFSQADLAEAEEFVRKLHKNQLRPIAEAFIVGQEYCVDGVLNHSMFEVLGIGKYQFLGGGGFQVDRIAYEPVQQFQYFSQLSTFLKLLFGALNYEMGPFHVEFKITDDREVALVECHGRFGGSLVTEAIQRTIGISPFLISNGVTAKRRKKAETCLIQFIYESQLGRDQRALSIQKPWGHFELYSPPPAARSNPSRDRRLGFAIAEGRTISEAEERIFDMVGEVIMSNASERSANDIP